MKHIAQLTEFMTGMDTRIGYPNEHLSTDSIQEMACPMYATGIGLVIEGIGRYQREFDRMKPEEPAPLVQEPEPVEKGKKKKEKKEKEKKPQEDSEESSEGFSAKFLRKIRGLFDEEDE